MRNNRLFEHSFWPSLVVATAALCAGSTPGNGAAEDSGPCTICKTYDELLHAPTSLLDVGAILDNLPTSTAAWWQVRPSQTEPRILRWAKKYPELVSLETQKTFGGRTAYAVTVTNRKRDDTFKRKLLISQPHAHEPAATAAMMDIMAQLLEGVDLSGRPTALDRRRILDGVVITFIPDGNPDGRAAAPADWWDGTAYSNDRLLKLAFGQDIDGRKSKRVGRWNIGERDSSSIGFAYERINDREFVEPNRDRESTYFRLVLRMNARYAYDLHLDLHQTSFERSHIDCQVFVPFLQKKLPPEERDRNLQFGRAIVAAWSKAGSNPQTKLTSLGYGEDQIQYFRKCWSDIYRRTPCLMVEIQMNNPRTPPRRQLELTQVSIVAAIAELFTLHPPLAGPSRSGGIGRGDRT